jgi:hypothetical protein
LYNLYYGEQWFIKKRKHTRKGRSE